MSTFSQIYYHIVFSTKNREQVSDPGRSEDLYRYVNGIFRNERCKLYQINGTADHLHILCDLHPTRCLSDLLKDSKIATAKWIKEKNLFPKFSHWQDGYAAFTHSALDKDQLMAYIRHQAEHHKRISFREELRNLLIEAKIQFEEKYLW